MALSLLLPAAASASTPRQYRADINALCPAHTPRLRVLYRRLAEAQKAHDASGVTYRLGQIFREGFIQDRQIEARSVPPSLRLTMRPILTRLRTIDQHVLLAAAYSARRNGTALLREIKRIGTLSAPLDRMLDSAGLRDCGSTQTRAEAQASR
jgi:hypothetical protein